MSNWNLTYTVFWSLIPNYAPQLRLHSTWGVFSAMRPDSQFYVQIIRDFKSRMKCLPLSPYILYYITCIYHCLAVLVELDYPFLLSQFKRWRLKIFCRVFLLGTLSLLCKRYALQVAHYPEINPWSFIERADNGSLLVELVTWSRICFNRHWPIPLKHIGVIGLNDYTAGMSPWCIYTSKNLISNLTRMHSYYWLENILCHI